ncbi:unnamed protein product [Closterium sp. Naga37s-1]|nr:unnamed protein product [Closterium sp. Naga37s-1]
MVIAGAPEPSPERAAAWSAVVAKPPSGPEKATMATRPPVMPASRPVTTDAERTPPPVPADPLGVGGAGPSAPVAAPPAPAVAPVLPTLHVAPMGSAPTGEGAGHPVPVLGAPVRFCPRDVSRQRRRPPPLVARSRWLRPQRWTRLHLLCRRRPWRRSRLVPRRRTAVNLAPILPRPSRSASRRGAGATLPGATSNRLSGLLTAVVVVGGGDPADVVEFPPVPPVAGVEFVPAGAGAATGQYPPPVAGGLVSLPAAGSLPFLAEALQPPQARVLEAVLGQLFRLAESLHAVLLIQVLAHSSLPAIPPDTFEDRPRDVGLDTADQLAQLLAPVLAAPSEGGVAAAGQLDNAVRGLRRHLRSGSGAAAIGASTLVVRELWRSLTGVLHALGAHRM